MMQVEEAVTNQPLPRTEIPVHASSGQGAVVREPRSISLRSSLLALVCLCVVPVGVAALYLVYMQYQTGVQRVHQATLLEARHRAAELDRELSSVIAGMKVLASAPELATDDLDAWHARANAAVAGQKIDNYLLTDRVGRQHVNTLLPFGSALPATGTPTQLARVFTNAETVVTDVFIGPVTRQPVMAIGVPVWQSGEVRYSLNIGMTPRRFQQSLEAQALPPGWVATVLDSQGTIVARTRGHEQFVGKPAVPEVVAQIARDREGTIPTVTVDGVPVVSSFSRSELSGWSVAVGAPRQVLERQLWWLVTLAVVGVVGVAAGGLWLALRIARRVTGAVDGLNAAAAALVDGQPVRLPALQLQEAKAVGQGLLRASEKLRQTRHAAQHDALTGLANRARFGELLQRCLAVASRRGVPFTVLMLDLDDLKQINDARGHGAGDSALRATARRILASLRAGDAAARLGGDEFAVLLQDADEAQARVTAARLLEALASPDDEYTSALGVSIGIAEWPAAGRDPSALLRAADAALYEAKRGGKGRVVTAPAQD